MKFDWHKKNDLLEQKYFVGSMSLFIPCHSFSTCGCPEALPSASIFKKCGVRAGSGGQEQYILKTN